MMSTILLHVSFHLLIQMCCYMVYNDIGFGFSQGPASQWVDVMKRKRAIHEGIINLVHQKNQERCNNHVEEVNFSA